jgi:hypothetical protein
MNEFCIVACGKKKIWDKDISAGPVKSKDLYTGIFTRKCIEYAEKYYKKSYYILSAKHGFLHPEETVENPYIECFHLTDTNPITKEALILQIRNKKLDEYEKIIILGGNYYTEMMKDLFPKKEVINPLKGISGIGEMMKKLNELNKN